MQRIPLALLLLASCASAPPATRGVRVEPTDDDAATIATTCAALGVDTIYVPASRVKDVLPEARKRGLRVYARVRVNGRPFAEAQDELAAEVKAAVAGADGVHLEGLEFDSSFADDERTRILFGLLAGKDPEEDPAGWKEFQAMAVRQTVEKAVCAVRPLPVTASGDAPVDLVFGTGDGGRVVSRDGVPLNGAQRGAIVAADPAAIRGARGAILIDGYAEAKKRIEAIRDALK